MAKKSLSRRFFHFCMLSLVIATAAAAYTFNKKNINLTDSKFPLDDKKDIPQYLEIEDGYQISIFAQFDAPVRQITEATDGWFFVGSRGDKVFAVQDTDQDGEAERIVVVASELNHPHGVAFHAGDLYIGTVPAVYRIPNIMQWLEQSEPDSNKLDLQPFITKGLVNSSHHGMRAIEIGPDNKLYLALGVPCNICEPPSAEFTGVIRRYALGGDDTGEVYASGIRNAVGIAFHPQDGALWFTDNGRDWLGDDSPHDELNRVVYTGEHFGYPYCHQGDLSDPEYGNDDTNPCDQYSAPMVLTGAHVANLGLDFDAKGEHAYIALHGSWNSSVKVGYAVYRATINNGKVVEYAPFVTGWLRPDESVYGRPVDVILATDSSLLVTDDHAGVIYRITKTH